MAGADRRSRQALEPGYLGGTAPLASGHHGVTAQPQGRASLRHGWSVGVDEPNNASTTSTSTPRTPDFHATSSGYPVRSSATKAPSPTTQRIHVGQNRRLSKARRLGGCATTVLILGAILILVSLGFLAFLWFSNHQNAAWRYIVVNNYLVTVVTGFGKILETSLTFQVGTAVAMIAALLLEGFHVLLPDAASISKTRTEGGGTALLKMLWQQLRGGGPPGTRNWTLLLLAMIAGLMLLFTQVITVVLNADIGLANLQGFQTPEALAIGFQYNASNHSNLPDDYILKHGISWSKSPAILPAFAEYSEPPVKQDGVSDTGVTMRAFLPYSSQQARTNLQSFSGRTTVVDTRVTCQVPNIQNITVKTPSGGAEGNTLLIIDGFINATRSTPRLNTDTFQWPPGVETTETSPIIGSPIPITCMAPLVDGQSNVNNESEPMWRTSLCQLAEGGGNATMFLGGLVSEFQTLAPMDTSNLSVSEESYNWGVAYLFLNVTEGVENSWNSVVGGSVTGYTPPSFQDRGEWRDYVFSKGDLILSATLCFASFMSADVPVNIQSSTNRSEPTSSFNFATKSYIYPSLRDQMGQNTSMSLTDRGVLDLKSQRSSWLANSTTELPLIEPYIRDFANMGGVINGIEQNGGSGNGGNVTALLTYNQQFGSDVTPLYLNPDPFFTYLFQDIVRYGGSVGFALQSMYTVMASMAYYDQFPQFDKNADVQRTDFVTVNLPISWSGYISVAVILVFHLLVLLITVLLFLARVNFSMLSNDWAMVAQTTSPTTADMIAMGGDMTEKEIRKWLENRSRAHVRVGLAIPDGSEQPCITELATNEAHGAEKLLPSRI